MSDRKWHVIDAEGLIVGRLATRVAHVLRGKHKPSFTPNTDCGDHVIIINADKVKFTGKKFGFKQYIRHTGYPGGQRFATPRQMMERKPHFVLETAVRGMLPKNRLGRQIFNNLHVYAGTEHQHESQQPQALTISNLFIFNPFYMEYISALGRRKTSIARVRITPGSGSITINKKPLEEYFPKGVLRIIVNQPFSTLEKEGQYDVIVNVKGGGITGQAEAIRLGISRALVEIDADNKPPLKAEGFTTRDPRMVERKKYGRRKARRRFQFSKR